MKRAAFTLIELMIAISILSIMMIFLYSSYSSLNLSNNVLKSETKSIVDIQTIKKVIYMDFSLALKGSVTVKNREKNEDFVYLQSSNSIHRRYNPYIIYIVKENKLYRLESLKKYTSYELLADSEFDIDYIGEVENFRVYKSSNTKKELYIVHIDFKRMDDILLKVKVLNAK